MSHPVRACRRCIQRDHESIVDGIDYCADMVSKSWDGTHTTDRKRVVQPMRSALESAGILEQLPIVLADSVESAGYELSATPVPAPPYVVLTSQGPICRATVGPGRILIRFDVFDIARDPEPVYQRRDGVQVSVSLE
ncbi:hypothetical protein HALLA_11010 [Halostagnicola larsenii XH-48]|uniref:DUF7988 domain-containing protein n=1 Tax=Halostagnicola larsenii XH-48 TaxID=797299 RepID=W0JPX5_9EURY|nr:hypothetical protein [Halostagnicola larsenii]AHF99311.1 hypothetical protein HALLA_11010 [Halostagnicola larsenii XH-48]